MLYALKVKACIFCVWVWFLSILVQCAQSELAPIGFE